MPAGLAVAGFLSGVSRREGASDDRKSLEGRRYSIAAVCCSQSARKEAIETVMKPLTLIEIRQAVGGRALTPVPAEAKPISQVSTDTRQIAAGSLFVAVRGDKFDGHHYLAQAAAGGAVAAIVEHAPSEPVAGLHLIGVADSRQALGRLAATARKSLRGKVIAVAGSNGKTGTKHLIHAALSTKMRGTISPKSFNNDIGVPLTILPVEPSQDYVVVEMGTNHRGEIRALTKMASPDIAVITNCGVEHLAGLGDLAGVRIENASITEGMTEKGLLVVNGDDEDLLGAVSSFHGRRITFGAKPSNDLFATDIKCGLDGVRFRLNKSKLIISIPLLGKHTAVNALAAIAIARRLGIAEEAVVAGLATASGPEMRLQHMEAGGVTIINDAYNANPDSMRAALETLAAIKPVARRIAILGDMLELGELAQQYHREMGQLAGTCGLGVLACVGECAQHIAGAAAMSSECVIRYPDAQAAAEDVPKWLSNGDLVLLKGSRGVHLELVAKAIAQRSSA
jgi:UDP-N-acetylmuramoyl-tripeptide--D-alanyl-D-alanine ligase